jgi:hypothetical protein
MSFRFAVYVPFLGIQIVWSSVVGSQCLCHYAYWANGELGDITPFYSPKGVFNVMKLQVRGSRYYASKNDMKSFQTER